MQTLKDERLVQTPLIGHSNQSKSSASAAILHCYRHLWIADLHCFLHVPCSQAAWPHVTTILFGQNHTEINHFPRQHHAEEPWASLVGSPVPTNPHGRFLVAPRPRRHWENSFAAKLTRTIPLRHEASGFAVRKVGHSRGVPRVQNLKNVNSQERVANLVLWSVQNPKEVLHSSTSIVQENR